MPGVSLEQGDTVRGKISREDVADLVLALLELPEATGTTFEVKGREGVVFILRTPVCTTLYYVVQL